MPNNIGVVRPYHGINPRKTPRRRRHLRPPARSTKACLLSPSQSAVGISLTFASSRRSPVSSADARSDPHHLRFAQPRALGLKVSDEFTVPLCRGHHRELHRAGNEGTLMVVEDMRCVQLC